MDASAVAKLLMTQARGQLFGDLGASQGRGGEPLAKRFAASEGFRLLAGAL